MKFAVYSYREDEIEYFKKFCKKYSCQPVMCNETPSVENADLASGCKCISMITTPMTENLLKVFREKGVEFISTRSIGFDHIDVKSAKKLGIHIGNVTYAPGSVADYTVMMILMATRKVKDISRRAATQDYSLQGVMGKSLQDMTVGVIGTGKIGRTVIKRLSGFECKILAYDLYENDEVKKYAQYVPIDRLLSDSDVITMHMPATNENHHFINKDSIAKMKDGVFIVNTARGSLINTQDFVSAIENRKIAGAALDVIENEAGLYYNNMKCDILKNHGLSVLKAFPNVIVMPHTAFYTDRAVSDMVEHSILSCLLFEQGKENPWQVV